MPTSPSCLLVRYGQMRHIGRFAVQPGDSYERGALVVVQTTRGRELGEVLTSLASVVSEEQDTAAPSQVLRAAGPEDHAQAHRVERDRFDRLRACERVFRDGVWPLEVIDAESLLDGQLILYYLGPHQIDRSGLAEALRERCGFDVILEPLGRDEPAEQEEEPAGCGSCGSGEGGCGSGGCGSSSAEHGGGCSGCAVKDLVARRMPTHAV